MPRGRRRFPREEQSGEVTDVDDHLFDYSKRFLRVARILFAALSLVMAALAAMIRVSEGVRGTGYIRPRDLYPVKSPVTGIIDSICVDDMSCVSEGDTLALLDQLECRASLEAALGEASSQELGIRAAEAALALKRGQLAGQIERHRAELAASAFIAEQERGVWTIENSDLEGTAAASAANRPYAWRLAELRAATARAALASACAETLSLRMQSIEIERLKARQAELARECEHRRRILDLSVITAPAGGTVFSRDLRLRTGDYVGAGEILLQLGCTDQWIMRCYVSDTDIPRVRTGQAADIYLDALPHMTHGVAHGTVLEVAAVPEEDGQHAFFRVDVRVGPAALRGMAGGESRLNGLRGSVRLVVSRRSLFAHAWRELSALGRAAERRAGL